jgi:hypothetical protein
MIPTEWATDSLGPEVDTWAVMDDGGIIHDGNENDMHEAFQAMVDRNKESTWWYPWSGDLQLIHIVRISR